MLIDYLGMCVCHKCKQIMGYSQLFHQIITSSRCSMGYAGILFLNLSIFVLIILLVFIKGNLFLKGN